MTSKNKIFLVVCVSFMYVILFFLVNTCDLFDRIKMISFIWNFGHFWFSHKLI